MLYMSITKKIAAKTRKKLAPWRKGKHWAPRLWRVKRIPYQGHEPMLGGSSRRGLTIHNEGVDRPCNRDHAWLAHFVNNKRIPYHALWCPHCGWWCQLIPFDRAARSMVGGSVQSNGASANRAGIVNVQICVVSYGYRDFTKSSPMKRAWVLAEILDHYQIPSKPRDTWGAGARRSLEGWARGGVQGHQHGPHDDHTDPGSIDARKLIRVAREQQRGLGG